MEFKIEDISPCEKKIKVTVPAEKVQAAYDECLQSARRAAVLPGFRRGKVPKNIVERRFAKEIQGELIERLLPQSFQAVLDESKLRPVTDPDVSNLEFERGSPLRFEARIEIMPDIVLSAYKGLEAEKPKSEVRDEDVNAVLEKLREKAATLEPVESRSAQEGDYLSCDVQSKILGVPEARPREDKNILLVLGKDLIPDMVKNLTGISTGEEKTFTAHYPDDFQDASLAGKQVQSTVLVHAVKARKLPPLDDAFVKQISDTVETLEAFRERIRSDLIQEHRREDEKTFQKNILNVLREKNPLDVPPSMVERQMDAQVEQMAQGLAFQGIDPRGQSIDWKGIREKGRENAGGKVQELLLLHKIEEVEGIEASDGDVKKEFERMAAELKTTSEELRRRYRKEKGRMERLRSRLTRQKTIDFLVEHAKGALS